MRGLKLIFSELWEDSSGLPEKWSPSCHTHEGGLWQCLHWCNLQEWRQAKGQGEWIWWAEAECWQRIHHPPAWHWPCFWRWAWQKKQTQVGLQIHPLAHSHHLGSRLAMSIYAFQHHTLQVISLALWKLLTEGVTYKYGSMTGHHVFNGKQFILPVLWLPG